jgi:hypothetical protein
MTKKFAPPSTWAASTPVERAAHLYECFSPGRAGDIAESEGISNAQISEGFALAEERKHRRLLRAQFYGSPEYGSRRDG